MSKEDETLDHLMDYILNRGWSIFPVYSITGEGLCACAKQNCEHPGKHPLTHHGFKNASKDEDKLIEWFTGDPRANWAVATGSISNIVIIDIDPERGGDIRSLGELPDTLTAKSGGGGLHLYFSCPNNGIGNSVSKIAEGIDVRGDGGYVITPPSNHVSGDYYEWLDYSQSISELPEDLLAKLAGNLKPFSKPPSDGQIRLGTRNDTLTRIGGSLRRYGQRESVISEALKVVNRNSTEEPLDEKEVNAIAKSISRYVPVEPFPLTDLGNAERLADTYSDRLKHVNGLGWLDFDGIRWVDAQKVVTRLAKRAVREMAIGAKTITDSGIKEAAIAWSKVSESSGKINSMIALAENEPRLSASIGDFDTSDWLFNCKNGTLDLHTGKLNPHNSRDFITKTAHIDFLPGAIAPTWSGFLDRIFDGNDDVISFIQKAVGYSLTGDVSEQCFFILYGEGANGKTTFLESIRAIMGDYVKQTDFNTFSDRRSGGTRNDLAALLGSRLVVASEVPQGSRLAESLVKQITGGDRLSVRFLYKEFFEYKPRFKVWLATNRKPLITGNDHAIWRRVRLIPFPVTIPYEEQDRALLGKLIKEKAGILNWALEGCMRWQSERLGAPPEIQKATKEYQEEMDTVGAFINESCSLRKNSREKSSRLYQAYLDWCDSNSTSSVNQKEFSNGLVERGFIRVRKNDGVHFIGIELLKTEEATVPTLAS